MDSLQATKVEQVFDSPEPAIVQVRRSFGQAGARAVISYLVSDALEFFNVTETMTDRQVAMTVDLIIEEYPYLKMDDLKLCFKNAMKMKYGQIYNRIDGQVILGWLKAYNAERCEAAQTASENEAKSHLQHEKSVTYMEYFDMIRAKAAAGDKDAAEAMKHAFSASRLMRDDKIKRLSRMLTDFDRKRSEGSDSG